MKTSRLVHQQYHFSPAPISVTVPWGSRSHLQPRHPSGLAQIFCDNVPALFVNIFFPITLVYQKSVFMIRREASFKGDGSGNIASRLPCECSDSNGILLLLNHSMIRTHTHTHIHTHTRTHTHAHTLFLKAFKYFKILRLFHDSTKI